MHTKQIAKSFLLVAGLALAACGGGSGSSEPPPPSVTHDLTVTKAGNGVGTVTGGGINCGATCTAAIADQADVTLTATAASGSSFGGWSGACTGTTGPCVIKKMADAKAVTATFLGQQLTITKAGTGGGNVTTSPEGLSCGAFCTAFAEGTVVTLSAAATPDSTFSGWTGDCTGTTCTVTMSAAKSVTATFAFSAPIPLTGGGTYCYLPSEFKWDSTDSLVKPSELKTGYVSLKDFSTVDHGGKHIVYMSDVLKTSPSDGTYGATVLTFDDWSQMGAAAPTMPVLTFNAVAPTLFYFEPKSVWVLAYQWGPTTFSYRTSTDPTDPSGWSDVHPLYDVSNTAFKVAEGSGTGPIDQTVICDATDCYLFFAGDNGKLYRSSMARADFPGTFPAATRIMRESVSNDLFEAVQVYAIEGTGQYLMIVECIGANGRYFRAFTATGLGGTWTPITNGESKPFAGKNNVTFTGTAWTDSISHGDLVRANPDQTFTVNACDLQLLYQGYQIGTSTSPYNLIPWLPGLLTLHR